MKRVKKIIFVFAILALGIILSIIIINVVVDNKIHKDIENNHYKKSVIRQLGYDSLSLYSDYGALNYVDSYSKYIDSIDEKGIYFDVMLEDPNLSSKLKIAFELINSDSKLYGDNTTFEPITVNRLKNDLIASREEMFSIGSYFSALVDDGKMKENNPQYIADYMKLAEEQLKESGDYIEWDEEFAGRSAYLNYWTNRIDEMESNPFKRIIQGKKLEGYKKRTIDRFLYTWEIESYDYEGICKEYEEIEGSKEIESALIEFEKIMQEENPEIGYGTDYELITTDRLLNDYESVYSELTGEMSDKLDEKYETKYYVATLFCRALWGQQPDFLYEY